MKPRRRYIIASTSKDGSVNYYCGDPAWGNREAALEYLRPPYDLADTLRKRLKVRARVEIMIQ